MEKVTAENVKIGDKVVRGADWKWIDQDKNSTGEVIDKGAHLVPTVGGSRFNGDNLWVHVKWENGFSNAYRVGPDHYDLYFDEHPFAAIVREINEQHEQDQSR